MSKLVLLRHGQSEWNEAGRFTGWADIALSPLGQEEAKRAGVRLRKDGIVFDVAFASVLKRAIRTAWIVMDEMDLMWMPLSLTWRLNEKHYGALQGLSKKEMSQEHGKEQVHAWRRGFDVRPPPLDLDDPRHPRFDRRYDLLPPALLPSAESLKDTMGRTIPYWEKEVLPRVQEGCNVLVAAHGNSLRALVKHLEGITDEMISELNIPTGIPLVYEMESGVARERRFLASDDELAKATEKAAAVR